jgi:DNA polymerase-4
MAEMPAPDRTIFHVDMDAFFVSVEELFNPALRGKAVVVGGQANERGVVAAASYEARKFGIHSAMPLRTAYKLCPHAIFVDGHPDRYRDCSREVFKVLQSFTPAVEMASIDEAYLDLTGTERLHGPPLRAAHALHTAISDATHLNCSIGIARSRLVAKIASDLAKPNGILWAIPGQEQRLLAPLPVRKIHGVGKVMDTHLHALGVSRIADLARFDESWLEARFGRLGLALAGKARGRDAGGWFDHAVGELEGPKSIGHEHTFNQDTAEPQTIDAMLTRLAQMVARRLRQSHRHARTIHLKLRYSDFTTTTRARTLAEATQLDTVLADEARQLFRVNWDLGRPIRLLGIRATSLESGHRQADLLPLDKRLQWERAMAAADRLRDRFGEQAVSLAAGMSATFRERVHENPAALPGKYKTPQR